MKNKKRNHFKNIKVINRLIMNENLLSQTKNSDIKVIIEENIEDDKAILGLPINSSNNTEK